MSGSYPVNCHNCLFDVTNIEMSKLNNKCPRCGSGMFNNPNREPREIEEDVPNTGGNAPDVRGKPLMS